MQRTGDAGAAQCGLKTLLRFLSAKVLALLSGAWHSFLALGRDCKSVSQMTESAKTPEALEVAARDQFAALGRFIQNFENVVAALRGECARIIKRSDRLGIKMTAIDGRAWGFHDKICTLIFHHELIGAQTILDLWRALCFEERCAMQVLGTLSDKSSDAAGKIITELAKEVTCLIKVRNRLIHATWSIGRPLPNDEPTTIRVEKYRVGKEGFSPREDLPRSFDQLMKLGDRAERVWGKLGWPAPGSVDSILS